MKNKLVLHEKILLGLNWLLHSGIQELKPNDIKGGFNAWYDKDKEKYSFTYSEITGYALNLLVNLENNYPVKGISKCIDLSTNYLSNIAFDRKYNAVKCRFDKETGWLNNYCTFDNLIIANALLNRYRLDGHKKAFYTAEKILDTISNKLTFHNGVYARFISDLEIYQNEEIKWSTQWGPFLAKLAIPFLNIYDLTNNNKYKDYTVKILDLIIPMQQDSGRFLTDKKTESTFLHPHFYATEGFLLAAIYLKDNKYWEVVNNSLKWTESLQMENGGIASFVDNDSKKIMLDSPDINSQYLKCVLLSKNNKKDNIILQKIINRILSFQVNDINDRKSHGGFSAGKIWFYDPSENKQKSSKNHINTWVTIFSLDSLMLTYQGSKLNPFFLC